MLEKAEFQSRIEKVKDLLKSNSLRATLIYYDELNIANGWYISGWCPQFESGCILVTDQGRSVILGGPESEPWANFESSVSETRNVKAFMVPEEEYNAKISTFEEILLEFLETSKIKKLGIVGLNKMPHGIYSQILEELYGVEILDLTSQFEELRSIKSKFEIERIKKAYDIAAHGFWKIKDNLKAGVTEHFLAGLAEGKMRELGAEWYGFKTILGSGYRTNGVVPSSSSKVLKEGETVLAGVSPRYEGYNAAVACSLFVGNNPDLKQKNYMKTVFEAFLIAREQLRPGNIGKEMDKFPRKIIKDRGYGKQILVPYFHTIGLLEAEAPFFGPNSNKILKPNMTISIDISLFRHPKLFGIRIESGYLITEDGFEYMCPEFDRFIENFF